jgi:hypothetical protein
MSETFQINRRAKAGKGKTPFGLPARKLAELTALRQNEDFQKTAIETAFFNFTQRFVGHARDLARSGQKDAVRNWYRYFENARVVEIVRSHSPVKDSSVKELKHAISELGTQCHPLDVPDWETDIQAIRHCLEILVENLPRKSSRGASAFRLPESPEHGSFEASISHRKLFKKRRCK